MAVAGRHLHAGRPDLAGLRRSGRGDTDALLVTAGIVLVALITVRLLWPGRPKKTWPSRPKKTWPSRPKKTWRGRPKKT